MISQSNRKVGLVLNTTTVYGTQVVAGIAQFAGQHNQWTIQPMFLSPQGLEELLAWEPQGIIGRMECNTMFEPVHRLGIPVVDIDGWDYRPGVQAVLTDDFEAGRMAARHFLDRKYVHIAFCGISDRRYSNERQAGLREVLSKRGLCANHCYDLPLKWSARPSPRRSHKTPGAGRVRLTQWLRELPKPAGILCCEDVVGAQIIQVCIDAGLIVPEEVAVLGVGNDEAICKLAVPPLSSIPRPAGEIGYAAARRLHRLMEGQAPSEPERISPHPLVCRQSTDTTVVTDPVIRRSLQYIRDHIHRPFGVEEMLDTVGISRRSLELRFKSSLGRTPHEEILAARMTRAEKLLAETDSSVLDIAALCGFPNAQWFGSVFRDSHGMSPSRYRLTYRGVKGTG